MTVTNDQTVGQIAAEYPAADALERRLPSQPAA